VMGDPDHIPYATPTDFNRALADRIASAAKAQPYSVPQLRRQFAYGRLLCRVFLHGPEQWVLKGATGLLSRIPGRARHSMDVDLYFSGALEQAIDDLQEAADADVGDFFSFDVSPGAALAGQTAGRVLRVTAYLGDKVFETFPVDVVVTHTMTAEPDITPPIELIEVPNLPSVPYRTYPISDQIADKYAAIVSTYSGLSSTRYRDLVDLVLIARTQRVDAGLLRRALSSEHRRRGIASDEPLQLPSAAWREGYEKIAGTTPNYPPLDADDAVELVRRLVGPVLGGSVSGQWNPRTLEWGA
jgi:hypothetical protein